MCAVVHCGVTLCTQTRAWHSNMIRQLINACAHAMMQSSDRPPTCCSTSVAYLTCPTSSEHPCMAGLHGPRLSRAWSTSLTPHGVRRSSSLPERRLQTTSQGLWSCCCKPARSSSPTAKAPKIWTLSWTALRPHAGETTQLYMLRSSRPLVCLCIWADLVLHHCKLEQGWHEHDVCEVVTNDHKPSDVASVRLLHLSRVSQPC